jgi:hypothetical protein
MLNTASGLPITLNVGTFIVQRYHRSSGYNVAMHKLVILILSTGNPGFEDQWPQFLHAAERIPGLRRESTSRVSQVIYGDMRIQRVHELYFDSYPDLEAGLNSPEGQHTGQLLQQITSGRMILFLADHTEDDLERIRQYLSGTNDGSQAKT